VSAYFNESGTNLLGYSVANAKRSGAWDYNEQFDQWNFVEVRSEMETGERSSKEETFD
jgi:hypothetical protein